MRSQHDPSCDFHIFPPADDPPPPQCTQALEKVTKSFQSQLPEMTEVRKGSGFLKWALVTGLDKSHFLASCSTPENATLSILAPVQGMALIALAGTRLHPFFFDATVRAEANLTTRGKGMRATGLRVEKVSITEMSHRNYVLSEEKYRKFIEKVAQGVIADGLRRHLSRQLMYAAMKAVAEVDPREPLVLEKKMVVYQLLDRLATSRLKWSTKN